MPWFNKRYVDYLLEQGREYGGTSIQFMDEEIRSLKCGRMGRWHREVTRDGGGGDWDIVKTTWWSAITS